MKIYLDVSCLNRPFDDQEQMRNRLEAEAVILVLRRIDAGDWMHVSSEMVPTEIRAATDKEKRKKLLKMLPPATDILPLSDEVIGRAEHLQELGMHAADAVHVAAAEAQAADVMLTCDDRLIRVCRRHRGALRVRVCDPLTWMNEHENETNA